MNNTKPIIQLENCAIYQNDLLVLNNINLRIDQGEFSYLIGKTGSGKSSLLKVLYGELPLGSGTGEIAGFSLSNLKTKEIPYLRRTIGIVFQDFQLLMDRNVEENLLFVLKATGWKDSHEMKKRVQEVLQNVQIAEKSYKMPYQLSGGEQQRIVIARALLNKPSILIADEPTGNLDPDTADDIMRLLFQINKDLNMAVLMATHNYHTIEKFPGRLIKVSNGKLYDEKAFYTNS